MRSALRLAAVVSMAISTGNAMALRLGAAETARVAGNQVVIEVPAELADGESLLRVAVAPDKVYATLGLAYPPFLRGASIVLTERQGSPLIRVAGPLPAEQANNLLFEIDTNAGRVVRHVPVMVPVAAVEEQKPSAAAPKLAIPASRETAALQPKLAPAKPTAVAPAIAARPVDPAVTEKRFDAQMEELNGAIERVTVAVGGLAAQMRQDTEATATALATIAAATAPKPEPPKDWIADNMPAALAGLMGFLVGGLWFMGSRPKLASGSRVQMLGADNELIEGELVRLASPSAGKALPYRIADVLTGAPPMLEVRMAGQSESVSVRRPLDKVDRMPEHERVSSDVIILAH